ncbi:MAG: hypothetical protein HPY73_05675 [Methanomassiliicoccales archaeon]|nr:MAG: hypothetical protein HPY73_05675 [Methanomassiliicoccales archaeon]
MDDIRLEKVLEALIDDITNDMGPAAKDCYVLRRLETIMLELKSSNNSEVLRQIGGCFGSTMCYKISGCKACLEKH